MHSFKHVINIFIFPALIMLISSCGLLEPPDKNGELIIVLKKQESLGKVSIVQSDTLASVQCILKKGSTTVYNQNLTKSGSYYEGEIKNLEPADNYSVLLYGKNSSQNIIRRGYESSISVEAGKSTTVTLSWNDFTPVLLSPSNNAAVNDTTPSFDWYDISDASIYELQVDSDSLFPHPVIDLDTLTTSSYTVTNALSYSTYYWRVRTQDSQGNWGAWSDIWNFTIDSEAPSIPSLTLPEDSSTISDNTPYFDWSSVSNASFYQLQVDSTSSFPSPIINQDSLATSEYTTPSSLSDGSYYWRVRAGNSQNKWSGWSDIWSFTISTLETDSMTDQDGNVYQTVKIGDQWWMAENLKVTHYRNGNSIPKVEGTTEWINLASDAYCAYDNDESNAETYGYLYNWYAVNDRNNIAPEGWHVPTDEDWQELEMYLGMSISDADDVGYRGTDEGDKMKTESGWYPGGSGTNETGFSALPGGCRYSSNGYFAYNGIAAIFWTATEYDDEEAWSRYLWYDHSDIARYNRDKRFAFSVRLVKGEAEQVTLSSISISPSSDTLYSSQTRQFTCTATYSDNNTENVTTSATWSTSPGTAGSIDSSGLFTASSSSTGKETITASYTGKTATATVLVKPSVVSLEVTPSSVTLANGAVQIFSCTAHYSNESTETLESSDLSWSVSPGTRGGINRDGLFWAARSGSGTETVTAAYNNGTTGTATVTISDDPYYDMIYISSGEFTMGSNEDEDEQPIHTVYLDGYYIDKYEVTWARYAAYLNEALSLGTISATSTTVIQDGKELIPLDEYWCYIEYVDAEFTVKEGYEDYPAEYISWYGAEAYAEHYNKRLPTEAEWEKAARGTDGRTYPWGNEAPTSEYWYYDTKPVGSFSPTSDSPYGCADMAGNVWEYCADWYDANYYNVSPYANPSGPSSGKYRVSRGGGDWEDALRCSYRLPWPPDEPTGACGLRCAKD